ncbi:MAG: hypothetical protein CMO40_09740 [Verrucomicrobiaceae bacterium]|nr:hypothetical protein [Verrucomicrobiaceae bacterium]
MCDKKGVVSGPPPFSVGKKALGGISFSADAAFPWSMRPEPPDPRCASWISEQLKLGLVLPQTSP